MEKELVSQPSALPSRKVFLGAVAGFATAGITSVAANMAGKYEALAWLGDPEMSKWISVMAGFAVAYIFKEYSK